MERMMKIWVAQRGWLNPATPENSDYFKEVAADGGEFLVLQNQKRFAYVGVTTPAASRLVGKIVEIKSITTNSALDEFKVVELISFRRMQEPNKFVAANAYSEVFCDED